MKAVILVPYRPDGGQRDRVWTNVRQNLSEFDIPIVTGDNQGSVFERAHARNIAAAEAGDWDVALYCDADILVSRQAAYSALMRSYLTGAYSVAYSYLRYMTEKGTQQRLTGEYPEFCEWDEEVAHTWECAFTVRRDIFDEVKGFDERFRGYGGQVAAFFYAYATFGGRERMNGLAYHLHHELVDRSKEKHFEENKILAERYKAAVDDIPAMRKILEER